MKQERKEFYLLLDQLILLNELTFVGVEIQEVGARSKGVFKVDLQAG